MVCLLDKKMAFLVMVLGAQTPTYSMKLFTAAVRAGAKKSVYAQVGLRAPVYRSAQTQLLSNLRQNPVSQESWHAAQQQLLSRAAKQAEDLEATIRLAQARLDEQMHGEKPEPALVQLQKKEKRATMTLNAAYLNFSGAEQWMRMCTQAVMDLEHKQGDNPLPELQQQALALAHKDEREAGVNLRRAKEAVEQAKLELRDVQKQLNSVPAVSSLS